jgi:hypothetical protein
METFVLQPGDTLVPDQQRKVIVARRRDGLAWDLVDMSYAIEAWTKLVESFNTETDIGSTTEYEASKL